jgi:hypothetical protein
MTEVGEAVMVELLQEQDQEKCDFKPDKQNWTANLDGNSTALEGYLGNKPNANKESELSSDNWPSQAHHLIPHVTLKEHAVAMWLKKTGSSIMWGDTFYNVDHENNGVWLPYASALPEWKRYGAKRRRELMFKVMRLSGLQLHQGPHSGSNRYEVGEQPYKACVIKYLDKIKQNAVSHYKKKPPCKDCQSKSDNGKVPPRANTVRCVDMASELILDDIQELRIFVSRIAAEFAQCEGFD